MTATKEQDREILERLSSSQHRIAMLSKRKAGVTATQHAQARQAVAAECLQGCNKYMERRAKHVAHQQEHDDRHSTASTRSKLSSRLDRSSSSSRSRTLLLPGALAGGRHSFCRLRLDWRVADGYSLGWQLLQLSGPSRLSLPPLALAVPLWVTPGPTGRLGDSWVTARAHTQPFTREAVQQRSIASSKQPWTSCLGAAAVGNAEHKEAAKLMLPTVARLGAPGPKCKSSCMHKPAVQTCHEAGSPDSTALRGNNRVYPLPGPRQRDSRAMPDSMLWLHDCVSMRLHVNVCP